MTEGTTDRWISPRVEQETTDGMSSHMVRGVRVLLYDHVPAAYKARALRRMETALCVKNWKSPKVFNRNKTLAWGQGSELLA